MIVTVARRIKIQSGLPTKLWPYFVLTAVRIINRTPKKALEYKTPYEFVTKRLPDLSGYKVPGSKTYVTKRNIPALQKNDTRSGIGYYITNIARNISVIWLPHVNKVIASRDVRVDELTPFSWKNIKNPENVSQAENLFENLEHGNSPAIEQLIEELLEDEGKNSTTNTNTSNLNPYESTEKERDIVLSIFN